MRADEDGVIASDALYLGYFRDGCDEYTAGIEQGEFFV